MLTSLFAGMSILLIGDSHLAAPGYLITTLQDDLVKQGAVVQTIGVCGSNAGDWLKTTPSTCGGAERLNDGQIVLKGKDARTTPVTDLIAAKKPNLVVIVLGDKQVSAFLGSNVAPCAYIDSTQFSTPGQWPTTDGQHYTNTGYKAWGDAIAKQLGELPQVKALQKK